MGGGDLNMKKSWHPLLLKNQERVWLEEKKALEEKKKLDQLRKEKEEERQLQELQRLQEEQTGKKRTEKLEWMYATPATGSSQNPNDLEDYLLGKKRVDKMLTADENAKVGAAHKNFIAVQNANNARDIAAKIREDPLLAIKQQEQAAYEALLSNPLRLREMQQRNGVKPKKSKEEKKREKEERKRLKHEHKHHRDRDSRSPDDRRIEGRRSSSPDAYRHHRRSPSPYDRRSRSPIPLSRAYPDSSNRPRYDDDRSPRRVATSRSPDYRRHRNHSRDPLRNSKVDERRPVWPRSDESDDNGRARTSSRSRYVDHGKRPRSRSPYYDRRERSPPAKRMRDSRSPPPPPRRSYPAPEPSRRPGADAEERAARLAAMALDATVMSAERQVRLAVLLEKEKADLAAEEEARAKSKGMVGFLSQESKRVFGGSGGLEERIKRGRGGLVGNID
ncbi:Pre-mRNA-splicing factor CWC25 [Hypsizygus marmoreus]|uniref:Pre-mRNA-splicing factor CWC25 n=1 Tax=Hypsizygus marmoreus TaxID=39966 RepID=A0A369KET0_HYPMA|nr:Pre-mRNA-splicing factor CWC25 [Hypsizygus marmoreus]